MAESNVIPRPNSNAGAAFPIGDLFNSCRVTKGWQIALLCAYAPFGLVIALLRLFFGVHVFAVACLLPKSWRFRSWVIRCLCVFFGIVVTEDSESSKYSNSEQRKVLVANHVSVLDHVAIDLSCPCVVPSVWDIPASLMWCLGFADLGARQGRSTLIENAKLFCSDSSVCLLAFPEGAVTNGRRGMLMFSSWPFSLNQPVQPVVISINRPPFNATASVLGSRWWTDLFWFMFVPITNFKLKWLPVLTKQESDTPEQFAWRTEQLMCEHAKLQATRYTSFDAVEYAKQLLIEQRRSREFERKLEAMIQSVKDIMPQVPIATIKEDLHRTHSVDVTISNFLEGRVSYTPEPMPRREQPKKPAVSRGSFEEFRQTYDQRKREIIIENRRKYLERTNLQSAPLPASS